MKHLVHLALALAAAVGSTHYAAAQDSQKVHGAHGSHGAAASAELSPGEVKKIDKGAGKITIKHGKLHRLDMAPMTMVFRVSDPKMLDRVQEGDKIRFDADNVKGALTVLRMEVVK